MYIIFETFFRLSPPIFTTLSNVTDADKTFDIGPDPPKTKNFVAQPDPTQPDPWMDPTHVQL